MKSSKVPKQTLTNEQLAFLREEREKHLQGKSKSYSREEIKKMVRLKPFHDTPDAEEAC